MISLGGNTQLGIGIAIQLKNQFSGAAAQVINSMQSMQSKANALTMQALTNARNQNAAIAATASVASYALYSAAEAGAAFQHRINQIAIVGGRDLGKSRKQLKDFANTLSREFTVTNAEVATAMFENTKAGVTTGLEEITRYQVAASVAAEENLATVSTGLLGIMNSYGIEADKEYTINGKRTKGFAMVANSVTAVANATQSSIGSIGESMEYFSHTAHAAGMTLDQSLALVGKLSQSNILGSKAGVWLANASQHLMNNVGMFMRPKAKKSWAALGIDPDQMVTMINQGKMYEAFQMIDKAASGLDRQPRGTLLNSLFGERGGKAVLNAFIPEGKKVDDIRAAANNGVANDITSRQAKAMMNDLYSDFKFFRQGLLEFKSAFSEAAAPVMRAFLGVATRTVRVFSYIASTPVGTVLAGLASILVPTVAVMFAFRTALLTATIALNGFGATSRAGGMSNLVGAGLSMFGRNSLAAKGLAGVSMNAAGRAFVAAGQTVNYGGKIYKAGQILPRAITAAGGAAAGSGLLGGLLGGSAAGAAARGLPMLLRLGSVALRWLPVVGVLYTIGSLLYDFFNTYKDNEAMDPVKKAYLEERKSYMDKKYFGEVNPELQGHMDRWQKQYDKTHGTTKIAPNINLFVDGKKTFNKNLDGVMDENFNGDMNFNFTH